MLRALTRPVRLVLPLLALGCEVAAVESVAPAVAVNRCGEEDSPPCTKGVATCENGRCVAIKGSFSTILLDIHVPASGTASSGLSYLWREDNVDLAGDTWDIQLAPATDVIGSVTASPYVMNPGSDDECVLEFAGQEPGRTVPAAEDGSIPVDVLFFPADRVLGIENAGYTAKVDTTLVEQSGGVPPSYVFQTSLPQGEYDLYVKPRAAAEGACQLPPEPRGGERRRRRAQVPGTVALRAHRGVGRGDEPRPATARGLDRGDARSDLRQAREHAGQALPVR
jgi:hypothetical protein